MVLGHGPPLRQALFWERTMTIGGHQHHGGGALIL